MGSRKNLSPSSNLRSGVQGEKKSANDEGGKRKVLFCPHLSKNKGGRVPDLKIRADPHPGILTKDDLPVGHRAPAQIV